MDSVSFFWSFVKMLASLTLVIGLMIGALYLLKRYVYKSPAAAGGTSLIRVVASHHLGPKNSLVLVEVLGQIVLLGVSGQQVSNLTAITDPAARELLNRLRTGEELPGPADPFSRCRSLLRGIGPGRKDR
jgi:flagellar protein FliO/FliZ